MFKLANLITFIAMKINIKQVLGRGWVRVVQALPKHKPNSNSVGLTYSILAQVVILKNKHYNLFCNYDSVILGRNFQLLVTISS